MGASRRIALQGSTRGLLSSLLLFFLFYTNTSGIAAEPAGSVVATCRDPIARVVSIQGQVQIQALGASEWRTIARLDTPLCNGDKVRTGPQSRSALFIQPESFVRID